MTQPYRVLLIDPPWQMNDKLPGKGRGAAKHYPCMSVEQLARIKMPEMAEDSLMFMWRLSAMPEEALTVMHMLGFTPKSEIVWVKTPLEAPEEVSDLTMGMGRYVRLCHETCIIGARGKAASLIKNHGLRSVFFAPRTKHSAKPAAFYDIVEGLTDGEGPFMEYFARGAPRPGWNQVGHEFGTTL